MWLELKEPSVVIYMGRVLDYVEITLRVGCKLTSTSDVASDQGLSYSPARGSISLVNVL